MTSIRASFGIYFDHYGEALVNDFDEFGSAGLATAITNAAGCAGLRERSPLHWRQQPSHFPRVHIPSGFAHADLPYFNKYSQLSSGVANDPEFYLVNTFGATSVARSRKTSCSTSSTTRVNA